MSRTAGSVLVLGAIAMFSGAAIPFITDLGAVAWLGTPDELVTVVGQNPEEWRWANGLIAFAAVATAAGLAWVRDSLRPGGRAAAAGLAVFVIAASAELVSRILHMTLTVWVAEEGAATSIAASYAGLHAFNEGLIRAFIFLGFASLFLYGVAIRRAGTAPLGAMLVVFGLVGMVFEVLGAGIPALVYIGTAAIGVALLSGSGEASSHGPSPGLP